MPPNIQSPEIDHRSEEVQEIIGYVPHWMIRWGITVMFVVFAVDSADLLVCKYPDVVKGKLVLHPFSLEYSLALFPYTYQ